MADTHHTALASAANLPPVTPDAFMADRTAFWDRFTGFTLKTTVALFIFCGWLWWCAISGFSLLHVITLPVAVGIVAVAL